MKNLEGKIVIIAGVTGDIGGGIALELLKAGAKVIGFGRNPKKLNQLERAGVRCFEVDCTKVDDIEDAMDHIKVIGAPHAFVSSMGSWEQVDLSYTPEKFEKRLELDLGSIAMAVINSVFFFNQYFTSVGGGFIVDISSHAAEGVLPGNLTYAPAKAAVKMFTSHLREANRINNPDSGVVISQVVAQLVDTPKNRRNFPHLTEKDWEQTVQISEIAEWIGDNISNMQASPEKIFKSAIVI